MNFAWTTLLPLLLLVSVMDAAQHECTPCNEYRLIFQEHTVTDYAIKENSIVYDLNAATVCFFARDTDDNKPSGNQCLYSYATESSIWGNGLMLCTTPVFSVWIDKLQRDADVGLDHGKWNHVCFTWSNTNGDYQWYKDGVVVNSGTGVNTGGTISSGGTTVIGQDQDNVGGGFNADQSFVGDVTEVNVWSTVLSGSDIAAQYANCQITQGSVTWWSQFRDGVHGNVFVVDP